MFPPYFFVPMVGGDVVPERIQGRGIGLLARNVTGGENYQGGAKDESQDSLQFRGGLIFG